MGTANNAEWYELEQPGIMDAPATASSNVMTFPLTKLLIKVELFLGGQWVDISTYVQYDQKIKITRGKKDEASRATPSQLTIKLKNPDRRWSPRNPNGPYFGMLGRNIKIRVSINPGDRFYKRYEGEVAEWPQKWTVGAHRWTSIVANGILRRLQQGKSPLRSPLTRAARSSGASDYWALEEGSNATVGANLVSSGAVMQPRAASPIKFGALDAAILPDGMAAMPTLNGGAMTATAVAKSDTSWRIEWSIGLTANSAPPGPAPSVRHIQWNTAGGINYWWADEDNDSVIIWGDAAGLGTMFSAVVASSSEPRMDDGKVHRIALDVEQTSATNMLYKVYLDGVLKISANNTSGTTIGRPQVGHIIDMTLNPDERTEILTMGGVGVWSPHPVTPIPYTAVGGYIGETAAQRFPRICTEEGIPCVVHELLADTEGMGPQKIDTVLNLLRACEDTNEGFIDEDIDNNLRLNGRSATWNQLPSLVVDYNSGVIKPEFDPIDDDRFTRNDWTITQDGGATAQVVQETGPLNVQLPEADSEGVGRYDEGKTLSLALGTQALQHAGLRVSRGTVDEIRLLSTLFDFTTNPEYLSPWLNAMDNGSRYQIINAPDDIGGGIVDQIMGGYTETIDQFQITAALNGIPSSPEQVGILDYNGYLDAKDNENVLAVNSTDVNFEAESHDWSRWKNPSAAEQYNIKWDGEIAKVTAAASAVTDSFTRVQPSGWDAPTAGNYGNYVLWGSGGTLLLTDWTVTGTAGTLSIPANAAYRASVIDCQWTDVELFASVSSPVLATGDTLEVGAVLLRDASAQNNYMFRIHLLTDNSVAAVIYAPSGAKIAEAIVSGLTYTAAMVLRIHVKAVGSSFFFRVWNVAGTEPRYWTCQAYNTEKVTPGGVGFRSGIAGANTNAKPVVFTWDNIDIINPQQLTIVRSINGVIRAHAAKKPLRVQEPFLWV